MQYYMISFIHDTVQTVLLVDMDTIQGKKLRSQKHILNIKLVELNITEIN